MMHGVGETIQHANAVISLQMVSSAVARALALVALLSTPLIAQLPDITASARLGLGIPNDDYDPTCGDPSLAFSLDVQGTRRVFPQLSLDHFSGSGGGDDLCIPVLPDIGTGVGRLQLEGATRLGLGVGARLGTGMAQLEGVLRGGLITGRRGFAEEGSEADRTVLPHIGAQVNAVFFRYTMLSFSMHQTRLPLTIIPADGGPATTRRKWSPMVTMQFGVRVPF